MTIPDRVADVTLPNVVRLAVSTAFHNKDILPPHDISAYGSSFHSQAIAPPDLVAHITSGNAFTMGAFNGTSRRKDTFVSGQVVGLDLDDNISVQDCLANDFIRQYAYLIYPTPSSGQLDEDGNPVYKSRVLFILDAPVTDRQAWERKQRALLWYCSTLSPDPACKDAARLFYGSATDDYFTQDTLLPASVLDAIATDMEADIGTQQAERTQAENDLIIARNRVNTSDDKKQARYRRYAEAALDNMVSSLSSLSEGSRNDTLYKYGAAGGNFVGANILTYSEVEAALRGAALSSGLSQHEIGNTLPRAINDGQSTPFDTSDLDKRFDAWLAAQKRNRAQSGQDKRQQVQTAYTEKKQAIGKKIIDIQSYFETDAGKFEMIRHAHWLYLRGQYKSWWQTKDIPAGHISAILNLNNTRSSTALVLGRLHEALLDGRLSHAVLSISLISDATGLSRRVVSNAILELQEGGYVRFLGTYSIYTILHSLYKTNPQQSDHTPYLNPTPCDLWTLNLNFDDLNHRLYHQLCVKKTEYYHRRTVAKTTTQMAEDMQLSYEEFKQLEDLDSFFASDKLTKKARAELRTELLGDNKGQWRGWKTVLNSDFSIPIDWYECNTIKDVRGQMLRYWAKEVRKQNSREQLSRLLGCSETTLDNLYASYNVVSVEQQGRYEVQADFKDLRPAMRQLQKDKSAHIWMVSFKQFNEETNDTKWFQVNGAAAARYYKSNAKNISRVLFLYNMPSCQYHKSVSSWALNWQRFIVMVAFWMQAKHADILTGETVATPEDIDAIEPVTTHPPTPDDTPAEDKTTLSMQHVYSHHTPQFCDDQMALRVEMATGYRVIGQSVVSEHAPLLTPFKSQADADVYKPRQTQVIFMPLRGKRNSGLLQFIQDNKADKIVKKSHEVFGKDIEDYDEELNAEYKAEREKEIAALLRYEVDKIEVPDFDMLSSEDTDDERKVIQMPLNEKQELTDRQKLMVKFWTDRYETERKDKPETESRFKFIRKYQQKDTDEKAS